MRDPFFSSPSRRLYAPAALEGGMFHLQVKVMNDEGYHACDKQTYIFIEALTITMVPS